MEILGLSNAIKETIAHWFVEMNLEQRLSALERPDLLSATLTADVSKRLQISGLTVADVKQQVLLAPYCHLKAVFAAEDLPDTPLDFLPLPYSTGTIAGQVAALAVQGVLGMETVSYGSENDGALFVNLVAIPGEGKIAEKSQGGMRGHTDAVSFPFNGEFDSNDPRIAPSPDIVTLIGLRNPSAVPTTVMALKDVLPRLSVEDVAELRKEQFSVVAQHTFQQGTRDILGDVHTVIDEPVLKDISEVTVVRYSHRSVVPTEAGGAAELASNNLRAACDQAALRVLIEPGDVLVVSNRICLHGRGFVGTDIGGNSRWLLRTYGLNTALLDNSRRYLGSRPSHVLYP